MTNKINIHIIRVSRLFLYSKYWFKLLAKHYIIWMNFIVMSKSFHFSKPLTQCSWFPVKDFILPSRWYGLIDCYLWSSALVSMICSHSTIFHAFVDMVSLKTDFTNRWLEDTKFCVYWSSQERCFLMYCQQAAHIHQ